MSKSYQALLSLFIGPSLLLAEEWALIERDVIRGQKRLPATALEHQIPIPQHAGEWRIVYCHWP